MMKPVVLLLLLVTFTTGLQAVEFKPYTGTIKHPQLSLKGMDRKNYHLSDYKGQVVLVLFWATYCSPWLAELPSMNRLQERLQGKPFKILAIDMTETEAEAKTFMQSVNPEFSILLDSDGSTIQQWKVLAAPTRFIIAPNGEIKYTLYGAIEWDSDQMEKQLQTLMPKRD